MNTNYYSNSSYPNNGVLNNDFQVNSMGNLASSPKNQVISNVVPTTDDMLYEEQSYVENILRLNKGKLATLYFSFPDSVEWRDKTYTGIIEAAGRDHIIVSDPKNGRWYLLLMIYLNYVDFDEKINYSPTYYPKG